MSHETYEELAAGYALDALEPQDEQPFLTHLAHCPACQQLVGEFREAAGGLALLAEQATPPPELAAAILAAAVGPGTPVPRVPEVASLDAARVASGARQPRWRRPQVLLAAAAAAVVLAAGISTAVTFSGSSRAPNLVCNSATHCQRVVLSDAATHRTAAVVLVSEGVAYLVPSGLPADNVKTQIYVLWQVTGAHTPLAVASFDVRAGQHQPIRMGPLAAPYSTTWAFAISLENGRVIPVAPSKPVALGTVSS